MKEIRHSIKVPRIYKTAAKTAKIVKEEGGSLKNLTYAHKHTNIKGLYALVVKTLQKEELLDRLISKSKILIKEERADPWLIRILITELLFGKKKLPGNSRPVQTVLSYHSLLVAELKKAEKKGIVNSESENQGALPRYVRINTLKLSVADAVKYFQDEGWKLISQKEVSDYHSFLEKTSSLAGYHFMKDHHIKELLVFPNKTEFFQHELYLNGSIILQDKASCLASWILNPSPGCVTLDMCAAPGMKTTHLAAIMQNSGTLHAVEVNKERHKSLCTQIQKTDAKCVKVHHMDALELHAESCQGVEFILIDPSCSGSGMVGRPKLTTEENSPERLKRLGEFQAKVLIHALTQFPTAQRVVYSTCSVNVEENEYVVARGLEAANPDPQNPNFQVADNVLEGKWLHHGAEDYEWGSRCLYARPDVDLTNGFFIAVFERVNNESLVGKDTHKKRRRNKKLKETADQLQKSENKKRKRESDDFETSELREEQKRNETGKFETYNVSENEPKKKKRKEKE